MNMVCILRRVLVPCIVLAAGVSAPGADAGTAGPAGETSVRAPATPEPSAVLDVLERVADWQLGELRTTPSVRPKIDWIHATGHAGLMALDGISGSGRFRRAMIGIGEANRWSTDSWPADFADDDCVAQAYAELYLRERRPEMIGQVRRRFDTIIANWSHGQGEPFLSWYDTLLFFELAPPKRQAKILWWWCDALFMSPPAFVRLALATGDSRYRDFMVEQWAKTERNLYDGAEHLYYRDQRYIDRREANGRKVFWGRGNGWVLGGLVRVLQYLPGNDPVRAGFEAQFKDMCAAVLPGQQADGMWRASLLDPAGYPMKESSGSAFIAYALAWGVNQGLLDRARYAPAVLRAWKGLVGCVRPNGRLTYVQPVGSDPRLFWPESTQVYGVGAFLLAGSEMYRMAVTERTAGIRIEVGNRSGGWIGHGIAAVPTAGLPADPVVMDGPCSRIIPSWTSGSQLRFAVDLAPHDRRSLLILPRGALAAVPAPVAVDGAEPDPGITIDREPAR